MDTKDTKESDLSCLGVLRILCVDSAPLRRIENRSSAWPRERISRLPLDVGADLRVGPGGEHQQSARVVPLKHVERVLDSEPPLLAAVGVVGLESRPNQEVLHADVVSTVVEFQRLADRLDELAVDAGFLARLAQRGVRRRLALLDVTLRKNPDRGIFFRSDEENLVRTIAIAVPADDDASGLGNAFLHGSAGLAFA